MEKTIQNNVEQLQKFFTQPQETLKNLQKDAQTNNELFLNHVTSIIKNVPEKAQSYLKQQQDTITELTHNLSTTLKNNPSDWDNVGKIWFNFQTNQFTSYLNEIKQQNENFQKLISDVSQKS